MTNEMKERLVQSLVSCVLATTWLSSCVPDQPEDSPTAMNEFGRVAEFDTTNNETSKLEATSNSFVLPSGNIYCALVEGDNTYLRCEIKSLLNPLPPQEGSDSCEFDWGIGLLLSQAGEPSILCASDSIADIENVLEYGNSWQKDGFTCESATEGLRCNNSADHGFFLSREKWEVF